jgi:hypothetical protein
MTVIIGYCISTQLYTHHTPHSTQHTQSCTKTCGVIYARLRNRSFRDVFSNDSYLKKKSTHTKKRATTQTQQQLQEEKGKRDTMVKPTTQPASESVHVLH